MVDSHATTTSRPMLRLAGDPEGLRRAFGMVFSVKIPDDRASTPVRAPHTSASAPQECCLRSAFEALLRIFGPPGDARARPRLRRRRFAGFVETRPRRWRRNGSRAAG